MMAYGWVALAVSFVFSLGKELLHGCPRELTFLHCSSQNEEEKNNSWHPSQAGPPGPAVAP